MSAAGGSRSLFSGGVHAGSSSDKADPFVAIEGLAEVNFNYFEAISAHDRLSMQLR